MKIAICFLALVSLAVALPAAEVPVEASDELDRSKITPNNIYVEPINRVNTGHDKPPGGRIIGGYEVPRNSIRYQAAVIVNGETLCGGSLISTTRVLTAAHCTIKASYVEIRLAAHNVTIEETTQVRITSSNIRNHPDYNPGSIANDIALVLLPSTVILNKNIGIITLPAPYAGPYTGAPAFLTGWGMTSDTVVALSPVLLGVNLTIIRNEVCEEVFGNLISDFVICTSGAGSIGGCNGDSGGPLVAYGYQVGIAIFTGHNCEAGDPTVYTRVSSFRSWITSNDGV